MLVGSHAARRLVDTGYHFSVMTCHPDRHTGPEERLAVTWRTRQLVERTLDGPQAAHYPGSLPLIAPTFATRDRKGAVASQRRRRRPTSI
jgi:hypothetical protein